LKLSHHFTCAVDNAHNIFWKIRISSLNKAKPQNRLKKKNKSENKSKTPSTTQLTTCPIVTSKIKLIAKIQSLESNNPNFCKFICFVIFSKSNFVLATSDPLLWILTSLFDWTSLSSYSTSKSSSWEKFSLWVSVSLKLFSIYLSWYLASYLSVPNEMISKVS